MPVTLANDILPIEETVAPADAAGVVAVVREAQAAGRAVYPIGGGTSLDYGLPGKKPGIGLSLARLNRVVDYPARDMTITMEAGVTMAELARTLAAEGQWLPIDAPHPDAATIGGLVATAWCGPRRYGWGTVRDYVIGISAVDGRGVAFKGGGRVVKNVAGYDFCKLLTGSLGTLGPITLLTLKVKPRPECSVLAACDLPSWESAERLLAALVQSKTTPAAIELLAGPAWASDEALGSAAGGSIARVVVGLEGTAAEVAWMQTQLAGEWRELGVGDARFVAEDAACALWQRLTDFPAAGGAPLVVKASIRPSAVCGFVREILQIDSQASIQCHAGNGSVIARFANFSAGDVSRQLVGKLHPVARAAGGHLVVLSSDGLGELTRQAVWGGVTAATAWMQRVKAAFDPANVLNPGRFVV